MLEYDAVLLVIRRFWRISFIRFHSVSQIRAVLESKSSWFSLLLFILLALYVSSSNRCDDPLWSYENAAVLMASSSISILSCIASIFRELLADGDSHHCLEFIVFRWLLRLSLRG